MSKYQSFMAAFGESPKEDIERQMQELVNEQFIVSSSFAPQVYVEKAFGTLEFEKIEARVTHLIDSATGLRVGDDFKKITFRDLDYLPPLGGRFQFDNNIWLVYGTDNINSTTSACLVRRCNNTMNMLDRYGNIHQEPCYIEYKPTKTSVGEFDRLSLPFTKQVMYCQLNKWTEDIGINRRFMFGKDVFKITDRVRFNRTKTFDDGTLNTNRYYMDYDNLNEFDNIELGIADYKMPNWEITINKTELIVAPNATGVLTASASLDEEVQLDEPLNWYSSDTSVMTIDQTTGEYTAIANGVCTITCELGGNAYYHSSVNVTVTDSTVEDYENKLTPDTTYLTINETQQYSIYEYLNGEVTDTSFTIQAPHLTGYYKLEIIDGNNFAITNLKQYSKSNLDFVLINNRDDSTLTLSIELGGIF